VEVIVFSLFFFTMVFLLIKSRCFKIGTDQSNQFESKFMVRMIDAIAAAINFDPEEENRTLKQTKQYFINRVRTIAVFGTTIKIQLDPQSFNSFLKNRVIGERRMISEENAAAWIEKNVVGGITKELLDK